MRRGLAVVLLMLALVPAAAARPYLGVLGNRGRFDSLTGQRTTVGHVIVGWNQGYSWGGRLSSILGGLGEMPMLGLNTGSGWPTVHEAITPRGLALGAGDAYLVALNRAIADFGRPLYVRPFGEMNGHWNLYCAYTASGRLKDAAHSTRWFRKGFARLYVILHGGALADVNAQLGRLGLPVVRASADLAENAYPNLRVVWNPQGYGSPDVRGNSAQAYYPGDAYVDVVGNDLYDIGGKAEWAANERLYRAHPSKPYAFPEWGLWGIDDPSFISQMARFVRTHRRVELLAWFNGRRSGGTFDLGTKPRSRALYRRLIAPLG